jgi:hypothetical protein
MGSRIRAGSGHLLIAVNASGEVKSALEPIRVQSRDVPNDGGTIQMGRGHA